MVTDCTYLKKFQITVICKQQNNNLIVYMLHGPTTQLHNMET